MNRITVFAIERHWSEYQFCHTQPYITMTYPRYNKEIIADQEATSLLKSVYTSPEKKDSRKDGQCGRCDQNLVAYIGPVLLRRIVHRN